MMMLELSHLKISRDFPDIEGKFFSGQGHNINKYIDTRENEDYAKIAENLASLEHGKVNEGRKEVWRWVREGL
jgi:hypothetical protein